MVDQFVIASKGVGDIQRQVFWPFLRQAQLPIPPAAEQTAIVRYLGFMERRFQLYIHSKQKLIRLLGEQRQAIINRAITKGIDPTVVLKPSGRPWLGNIPEHWSVSRSKQLFSVRKELSLPDDVQLSATQAYGVIPQADFEKKVGRRVVKISMHLEKRRHVEKDDFVISMRSFQGGLERAWSSGAIRSSYVVLQPGPAVDVEFFSYLFKSHDYIRALQSTAEFIRDGQDLTFENFCRVDLPMLPIQEQRAIATDIARSTSGINSNVASVAGELDLIREYRSRLISDVVTGKVDVRDVAADLPYDIGEDNPILDEVERTSENDALDDGLETPLEEAEV
jgi:type I restriction enzyme S subunit